MKIRNKKITVKLNDGTGHEYYADRLAGNVPTILYTEQWVTVYCLDEGDTVAYSFPISAVRSVTQRYVDVEDEVGIQVED